MSSSTGTVVFNDSRIKAKGVIATESIGVGTANPTSNLHVVGDINFTGNIYQDGTIFSGGGSSVWTTSDSNVYYNTGNVGIGVAIPSYNLHVDGITRLNQFAGSRSGTFSGSGTFYLPGDLDYGFDNAPTIGWEIHMVFGFTGTNFGTFYISGSQDTSSSVVSVSEGNSFRIYDSSYGDHSTTAYLTANRETVAPAYYAKITLLQPYYNNVSASTRGDVSRHHFMFESVGCHAGVGSTKYQGSGFFQFGTSTRRPKYIRLTCSTGSVQGNYMINPLTT